MVSATRGKTLILHDLPKSVGAFFLLQQAFQNVYSGQTSIINREQQIYRSCSTNHTKLDEYPIPNSLVEGVYSAHLPMGVPAARGYLTGDRTPNRYLACGGPSIAITS